MRTIRDLAKLKDEDRRLMLRNFSEAEYHDLMLILAEMPLIDMEARCAGAFPSPHLILFIILLFTFFSVLDDDDPTITAGSIVTVTVNLTRNSMKDIMEGGEQLLAAMQKEEDDVAGAEDVEPEEETKTEEAAANPSESPARKPKVWEKQPRKKKGGKGGKPGKKVNKAKTVTPVVVKKPEVKEDEEKREGTPNGVRVELLGMVFISSSTLHSLCPKQADLLKLQPNQVKKTLTWTPRRRSRPTPANRRRKNRKEKRMTGNASKRSPRKMARWRPSLKRVT